MPTIFKLIIEDDEGKTTVYPLAEGEISIGRREGNTIRLMERNVSRRHVRLTRVNGSVFVEDLDSYNGVRINGERIFGRYEVKEGDLVEVGDYHLALQRSEVVSEPDPVPVRRDSWPQVGTVPDFRLPEGLLAEARRDARDTVIEQPTSAISDSTTANDRLPTDAAMGQGPLVRPPPRGEASGIKTTLPPFPGSGPHAPALSGLPDFPSQLPTDRPERATERLEAQDRADTDAQRLPLAAGPASVAQFPRLICVSTSYAGKEYALNRAELVIGRVEDNDVVIEHRSVSRNHAKILFDGRTHKIIDLQSANGILVNGEEYAMTDLRKGDLIELGHVRFRFTPAGEPFIPTEEETRELRDAGFEPPKPPISSTTAAPPPGVLGSAPLTEVSSATSAIAKSIDVPDVSNFDFSTAQTVTDTPLSALAASELPVPRLETKTSPAVPLRATAAKRASEDDRPTQSNRVVRSAAFASAAPMQSVLVRDEDKESLERAREEFGTHDEFEFPSRRRGILWAAIGLAAAVALSVGYFATRKGVDPELDRQLEALYAKKSYVEVITFFQANEGRFADEKHAVELYGGAKALQSQALEPDSAGTPQAAAPAEPELALEPPVRAAAEPQGQASRAPSVPARGASASTQAAAAAKNKTSLEEANRLFQDGKRALLQGELARAEQLLSRCIALVATHAECHRALGVYYAQRDETSRSIDHYQRYIRLKPNAPDAAKVRAMIEAVRGSKGAQ